MDFDREFLKRLELVEHPQVESTLIHLYTNIEILSSRWSKVKRKYSRLKKLPIK